MCVPKRREILAKCTSLLTQGETRCPLEAVCALQNATQGIIAAIRAQLGEDHAEQRTGSPVSCDELLPLFIASLIQVRPRGVLTTEGPASPRAAFWMHTCHLRTVITLLSHHLLIVAIAEWGHVSPWLGNFAMYGHYPACREPEMTDSVRECGVRTKLLAVRG